MNGERKRYLRERGLQRAICELVQDLTIARATARSVLSQTKPPVSLLTTHQLLKTLTASQRCSLKERVVALVEERCGSGAVEIPASCYFAVGKRAQK